MALIAVAVDVVAVVVAGLVAGLVVGLIVPVGSDYLFDLMSPKSAEDYL